jgi:hypothetical protein
MHASGGSVDFATASEARDRSALASALSVAILVIFLLDRASVFFLMLSTRRRAVSIRALSLAAAIALSALAWGASSRVLSLGRVSSAVRSISGAAVDNDRLS